MADQTQVNFQNPYAMFDPTQWSNAYSQYNNQALPWPSSYVGWPTDAMGNPIKPPQGTTINSSPVAPSAAPAQAPSPSPGMNSQQAWTIAQQLGGSGVQGSGRGTTSPQGALDVYNQLMAQGQIAQAAQRPGWAQQVMGGGAQPAAAQPAAPVGGAGGGQNLDYNSVLSLLANPGHVTTPGATVPAASGVQPGPGVLQSFLANWKPAQSGPGSQFQQGFANALKGMGYS